MYQDICPNTKKKMMQMSVTIHNQMCVPPPSIYYFQALAVRLKSHLFSYYHSTHQPESYNYFFIFLLAMPKYWGKQNFSHVSFPEVGEKQKKRRKKYVKTMASFASVRHHARCRAVRKIDISPGD